MWHQSTISVLQCVARHGSISRTDLATCASLSKAAITAITRELLAAGILEERTTTSTTGRGRPAVLLGFNAQYGAFVGVRVAEDPVHIILTDFLGNQVSEAHFPLTTDPNELATNIATHATKLAHAAKTRILRIGVAVSGIVDHTKNRVRHSANLGWRDVPLGDLVEQAAHLPITVENDANAVAVAEKVTGDCRSLADFVVVTLGQGIGGAHFLGGELQRGTSGAAGEIAHCTIDPTGELCLCGKPGCLDTVASTSALQRAATQAGLGTASVAELEERAATGNQAALEVLRHAGSGLGLALAHVANLLDPGVIIVVGSRQHLGAQLLAHTRQAFDQHTLPRLLATTSLKFKPAGEDIWARGAAALAAQSFIEHGTPAE